MPGKTGKIPGIQARRKRTNVPAPPRKVVHPVGDCFPSANISTTGETVYLYRAPCAGIIKSPCLYIDQMEVPEEDRVLAEIRANGATVAIYPVQQGMNDLPDLEGLPIERMEELAIYLRREYRQDVPPDGIAAYRVHTLFLLEV